MSERETKQFTTPGGRAVVLNAYLTGREANEIRSAMFGAMKLNMEDAQSGKVNVSYVPGTFLAEQERKALGYILVSIDGDAENPVEKLLDLPDSEYKTVVKEANAVQSPPTEPEKSDRHGVGTTRTA